MTPMAALPSVLRRPWLWAVLAVLLAGYAAAGFWLVPRLITTGLGEFVAGHYHRKVEVGAVTFNPFTLELTVSAFALPDADGGPLVAFDRLDVKIGGMSVLRAAPEFRAIALDGPRLRVVRRADGRVNLLDLSLPPDPQADPNAPPPRLWIDELAIRGGETTVVDETRGPPLSLTLKPIEFTLRNFSTRSEGNAYSFAAESTRGEALEWRGTFGLVPLASQGTFALKSIKARTLADLAGDQLPFDLTQGELDLDGHYDLAEQGGSLSVTAGIAELTLRSLGLRVRGAATDAVTIPRLTVKNTALDLGRRTVSVGQVLLEQPHVAVLRSRDGTLNLARLAGPPAPAGPAAAARAAAPPAPPTPAPSAPPAVWSVSVPDIRIAAADIGIEDQAPSKPATFRLAPLDLAIGDFALPARGPIAIDLKVAVNGTGHVSVNGKLDTAPLAGRLAVDLTGLPLAALQPYADDLTAMVINGGAAGLKGDVVLAAGGRITFDGSAGIDDFATVDRPLRMDFIKWRSVKAAGLHAETAPLKIAIRSIDVRDPYARVIVEQNGITNVKTILSPAGSASPGAAAAPAAAPAVPPPPSAATAARGAHAKAAPAPAPQALPLDIGVVRIAGGSVNFADLSVKPNFATGIQELAGTVKGLSGRPDARADVDLAGKVDRYAPVTISGKVNYFAAVSYTDLKVAFKNLELTGLSPYSGRFAGYRIERGKLSADFSYLVDNRKLDAKHHVVIDQLELGDRVDSPDATHLPVKFAIALLKDRNGVIDLELPVSGSLDDPDFKVGGLIWKVVINLIEKAVTAPFALLGKLFGGGEEVSFVDFAPGSATLDAAAKAKFQTLAKGLDARPALKVDIPLVVAPDADRAALAAARWQDSVTAGARARLGARGTDPAAVTALLANPKEYRALLEDTYREAFGHRAELPKPAAGTPPPADPQAAAIDWLETALKARLSVSQADLDGLAQARAAAAQAALLDGTGVEPARVFVITAPPASGDGPVRMQLAMH
jgi:uncharacterized protein involved in outer membrane biogenesis